MKSIREIAEEVVAEWSDAHQVDTVGPGTKARLVNAIEQALRDERARCRKIAQSWEHRSDVNPARAIASAIQQGIEP